MGDTSNPGAPRVQDHTPPPDRVADGAQSCILYVEKSLGVPLDYSTETLPVLDHYLREAGSPATNQPETALLLATVAGCYLGEVLRARHPLQWNLDDQPLRWSLTSHDARITIFPAAIAYIAIEGIVAERSVEAFALDSKLKKALAQRLALLPPVSNEEYVAPSTRIEVIDIAFDLLAGDTWSPEHDHDDHSDHVHDAHCGHVHDKDDGRS